MTDQIQLFIACCLMLILAIFATYLRYLDFRAARKREAWRMDQIYLSRSRCQELEDEMMQDMPLGEERDFAIAYFIVQYRKEITKLDELEELG